MEDSFYWDCKVHRAKLLKSPWRQSLIQSVVSVVESVGHTPSESDESELGTVPHPTGESPPGSRSGSPSTHTREGLEEGLVVVSNPPSQSPRGQGDLLHSLSVTDDRSESMRVSRMRSHLGGAFKSPLPSGSWRLGTTLEVSFPLTSDHQRVLDRTSVDPQLSPPPHFRLPVYTGGSEQGRAPPELPHPPQSSFWYGSHPLLLPVRSLHSWSGHQDPSCQYGGPS